MRNNLIETLVGIIVIILSGAFITYGYSVVNVGSTDGYFVTASFDRVDGLSIGSDVRMAGIKVGTVTAQNIDPKTYMAEVKMSIAKEVKLPDDSSAKIATEGLLGGTYISLTAGGSEEYLAAGGELVYTQGAIDFISLISRAVFSTSSKSDKTTP